MISCHAGVEKLSRGLEGKLHDPEQSMRQLIDLVVEMKNQSSNFHTLSSLVLMNLKL